jgi:hypothetical protein
VTPQGPATAATLVLHHHTMEIQQRMKSLKADEIKEWDANTCLFHLKHSAKEQSKIQKGGALKKLAKIKKAVVARLTDLINERQSQEDNSHPNRTIEILATNALLCQTAIIKYFFPRWHLPVTTLKQQQGAFHRDLMVLSSSLKALKTEIMLQRLMSFFQAANNNYMSNSSLQMRPAVQLPAQWPEYVQPRPPPVVAQTEGYPICKLPSH